MPERYHPGVQGPYFKDRFVYDATTDSYLCPQGQRLPFRGLRRNNGKIPGPFRVYRASRTVCRVCPAYGVCTKDAHTGRALWIGPSDTLLRKHRRWMATEQSQTLYARRKGPIEPAPALSDVFGVGPDTAATLLVTAGSNPERLRSEAAFAALCGVNPIPASSGKTNRHRLNRGGDRRANAALYRIVLVRLRYHEPTREYMSRRTSEE